MSINRSKRTQPKNGALDYDYGSRQVLLEAIPMKLTYDRDKNVAYLRLRPKGAEVDTIRISDEMNIDIAPDGSVYGIELLDANEQLRSADGGKLVVVDEVENREEELSLGSA
jgi:uncharacterized protein YuzE